MSMRFESRNFADASSGSPCYNPHALVALVKTFCSVKRGCESAPLVGPFSVFGLKGRRLPHPPAPPASDRQDKERGVTMNPAQKSSSRPISRLDCLVRERWNVEESLTTLKAVARKLV